MQYLALFAKYMNVLRSTSGDICDHKMALKMFQEYPPLEIIHLAKYNIMNKQTNKQKPKTEPVYNVLLPKSDGVGWSVEGGWGGGGRGVISVTSQCSQRRLELPIPTQVILVITHVLCSYASRGTTLQRAQDSTYGPTALSLESGSSASPSVQCKWRSTLLVRCVSSGAFNESVSRLGLQCD